MGNHYEVSGSTVKKYYYAGGQRVAMRENGTLSYILSDHLGSTSIITDQDGENPIYQRYKAWGEIRYTSGTLPTRYQYTGQYSYTPEFGLYFYNARWYDPALGRFVQADSVVPHGVQGWDRYAYVNNNPMRYVDPSGHISMLASAIMGAIIGAGVNYALQFRNNYRSGMSFSDAATNVNLAAIGGSAVGGFIFGLTLGIGASVIGTGYFATASTGAFAGLSSGQISALTEAGINEALGGEGFDISNWLQNANELGFLDCNSMIVDASIGMVTITLGKTASNIIKNTILKTLGPKHSIGGVPVIKLFKGEAYLEYSGRPGLYIEQTTWEKLQLAITLNLWAVVKEVLEELTRQVLENDFIDYNLDNQSCIAK